MSGRWYLDAVYNKKAAASVAALVVIEMLTMMAKAWPFFVSLFQRQARLPMAMPI